MGLMVDGVGFGCFLIWVGLVICVVVVALLLSRSCSVLLFVLCLYFWLVGFAFTVGLLFVSESFA